MKKVLLAMVMAALVMAVSVQAEEAAVPAAPVAPPAVPAEKAVVKKELPPAQDLELTGKVIQQEKVRKDKTGAEVKQTVIALDMTADGIQVMLPANKKDGVDPASFVGKDVKVFAKGTSVVDKKGKKAIRIQKIVKIEPLAP
jgi:hypothetical protein